MSKKSFILWSDFVFFSEEKLISDQNMKLLLFTERTSDFYLSCTIYCTILYHNTSFNWRYHPNFLVFLFAIVILPFSLLPFLHQTLFLLTPIDLFFAFYLFFPLILYFLLFFTSHFLHHPFPDGFFICLSSPQFYSTYFIIFSFYFLFLFLFFIFYSLTIIARSESL